MARGFCFAEKPGVVDGDRGAPCQILGGREIGLFVAPAALGRDECDRAEHAVAGDKRYAHRRLQSELFEDVKELRRVRRRLAQQLGGNLREELRLLRSDDVGDAVLRIRVGRIPLRQIVRPPHLLRVDVGDGEPFDRPVLGDDVDRAPVCEVRDSEGREICERGFVVERRREELAGLCDEALVVG